MSTLARFPGIMSLILITTLSLQTQTQAQTQTPAPDKKAIKAQHIKTIIDSQNFVFKVQSATPMSGRTRNLTSDYDLTITTATITSYLPYFGRAYTAPIDPSQGGLNFTSKDFDYKAEPRKKDGWDITIKPKDYRDVQQMILTVSSSGYGTLQVTSTSRQPISFYGYVTDIRSKKKS